MGFRSRHAGQRLRGREKQRGFGGLRGARTNPQPAGIRSGEGAVCPGPSKATNLRVDRSSSSECSPANRAVPDGGENFFLGGDCYRSGLAGGDFVSLLDEEGAVG